MSEQQHPHNNKNNGDILKITRVDQYRTIDELFEHSQANSSYYTLLILSTFVVTAGLLLDNSAIVIGGMLITPILTPLLVIGLGLAVGEIGAIRRILVLALKSALVVMVAAFLITMLFGQPQDIFALDNTIRTVLLYFIVAIGSGVAAAFAWARKEISEVLPGVSIAVSLVPPLSLIGIWLAAFELDTVRFYFLIFVLNLFGIVIGSLIVFSLLKFSRIEKKILETAKETEQAQAAKPEEKK